MDADSRRHPGEQALRAFGLGKLDDGSAEAINRHLEQCPECRSQVAEMSDDSFLGRLHDAQEPAMSESGQPRTLSETRTYVSPHAPLPFRALPPGLAEHSDYEILRELGHGGMGVVYLAHNKLMSRKEVLKVVSDHLVSRPTVLERFLREIRSAAKLHHPNIVIAYRAMHMAESIVFAMEYVEGLDLAKMVKSTGPLPVAKACNFVHQAALGLQHAHDHGMIHRDIKPSNLMLAQEGQKAIVKVLDFGLAKLTTERQDDSGLTREGQMLGTPDYIAPEQIRNAQSADIRADIYSLGCTLYYLLVGRPPFTGESLWDLYQAHFSMDANPLNLVRAEVPVELAALVAKMMAKAPNRRFPTPGAVAQALTPFFKKTNAALQAPDGRAAQAQLSTTGQPAARVRAAVAQPPTTDRQPAAGPREMARPGVPGARSESLIECQQAPAVRDTTSETAAEPAALASRRRGQPTWSTAIEKMNRLGPRCAWVGAWVLLLGVVIAAAALAWRAYSRDAVILLAVDHQGAEVLIDGDTLNLTWPGVDKPTEIRVRPGERAVEVKKAGYETFRRQVLLGNDGLVELKVHLKRLPARPPSQPGAVGTPAQPVEQPPAHAPDGHQRVNGPREPTAGKVDDLRHPDEVNGARSSVSRVATTLRFVNKTTRKLKVYWLDFQGQRRLYRILQPGKVFSQATFVTHPWVVTDEADKARAIYYPTAEPRTVAIEEPTRN
jgi:hypothetical protein